VIATKFGLKWDKRGRITRDASSKRVFNALDESLRRLKLDCIPLYQIHWPDPNTPLSETLEALKECQKAGKIRYIGCSNFSVDLINKAQKFCRVESLQAPYNLIDRAIEKELILCCRKWKMGLITYGSLVQGLFTGKYGKNSKFNKKDVRSKSENWKGKKFERNLKLVEELKKIGKKYGKTPAQIAIRWILDNPSVDCALTGIIKPEHIIENSGAMDWKLLPEDREFLTRYAEEILKPD
jgi:aryl-alcohol dehydrogenase-like predicted oxidoreductase